MAERVQGVDIIVPVMRPGMAWRFLNSVEASGAPWLGRLVTAVAHRDDTELQNEWLQLGAGCVLADHTGMPGKVNAGARATHQDWVLFVGEDVVFRPGWYQAAMAAAGDRFHLVGTNDLGNPRVLAGEHATHFLLRRSYVEQVGAGWDGPGVVMHEGYRHWFADDEIVAAAKQRGVWTPALDCVIEHMHPAFGKGDRDAVYELGESAEVADTALFRARAAANGWSL